MRKKKILETDERKAVRLRDLSRETLFYWDPYMCFGGCVVKQLNKRKTLFIDYGDDGNCCIERIEPSRTVVYVDKNQIVRTTNWLTRDYTDEEIAEMKKAAMAEFKMSVCNRCVTDKSLCEQCRDNSKYANIPRQSQFSAYIPTCPFGAEACINDPAYIKYSDPEWYQELFGDVSPQEVLQNEEHSCLEYYAEHKDDKYAWCPHYDDEDK